MSLETLVCTGCGAALVKKGETWQCEYCEKSFIVKNDTVIINNVMAYDGKTYNTTTKQSILSVSVEEQNIEIPFFSKIILKFEYKPRATKADPCPGQIRAITDNDDFVCITDCPKFTLTKLLVENNASHYILKGFKKELLQFTKQYDGNLEYEIDNVSVSVKQAERK